MSNIVGNATRLVLCSDRSRPVGYEKASTTFQSDVGVQLVGCDGDDGVDQGGGKHFLVISDDYRDPRAGYLSFKI
jgi:hypothetical protein